MIFINHVYPLKVISWDPTSLINFNNMCHPSNVPRVLTRYSPNINCNFIFWSKRQLCPRDKNVQNQSHPRCILKFHRKVTYPHWSPFDMCTVQLWCSTLGGVEKSFLWFINMWFLTLFQLFISFASHFMRLPFENSLRWILFKKNYWPLTWLYHSQVSPRLLYLWVV